MPVKIERELNDLFRCEPRALHAARPAINAVQAIIDAKVRQQYLQQRDTAAIRRVAVTDTSPNRRTDAAAARIAAGRSTTRTRGVILRRIREEGEFRVETHAHVQMNSRAGSRQAQEPFQFKFEIGPIL